MTLPHSVVAPQISIGPSTEHCGYAAPGAWMKCWCGKNLQRMGAYTAAYLSPQLGSTGPSTAADSSMKCGFCGTIVEIRFERIG